MKSWQGRRDGDKRNAWNWVRAGRGDGKAKNPPTPEACETTCMSSYLPLHVPLILPNHHVPIVIAIFLALCTLCLAIATHIHLYTHVYMYIYTHVL